MRKFKGMSASRVSAIRLVAMLAMSPVATSVVRMVPTLAISFSTMRAVASDPVEFKEEYANSPDDVKWQRGPSGGKQSFFKRKVCGKEVTYCFTYLTNAGGAVTSAVCRAQEVKAENGGTRIVCPQNASDCGMNDRTIEFPALGNASLRAAQGVSGTVGTPAGERGGSSTTASPVEN